MRRLALLFAMLVLLPAAAARAQVGTGTIRVAPSGSDTAGCGAVAAPCASLQFAVDQFALGSAGTILVAAGTYTSTAPREVLSIVGRRLLIAGGYSLAFTDADPVANAVAIDGQNARRGVSVGSAPGITDNELTLSGVTIQHGRAPAELSGEVLGCYGGGMDVGDATVLLIDVAFVDNHAHGLDGASGVPGGGGGGGIVIRSQSHAFLSRVTFTGNDAVGGNGTGSALRGGLGVGGAIFSYDSVVSLNGVTATSNTARGGDAPAATGADAGGQRADGMGGFWAVILGEASASHVTAVSNVAEGGDAESAGGRGIGGGVYIESPVAPVPLRSFEIRDNLASGGVAGGAGSTGGSSFGGGLFATNARVAVEATQILGNTARGSSGVAQGGIGVGGGISTDSTSAVPSELIVTNAIIARNAAQAAGGSQSLGIGGGIFVQCPNSSLGCPDAPTASSSATLTHVTLADNTVSGAAFNQGAAVYVSKNVTLHSYYGIVSGHAGPPAPFGDAVLVRSPALAHFETTLWDGNTLKSFSEPPSAVFEDVSPLAGAPKYVDPSADPPNYHLGAGSAAIDMAIGSRTRRDVDGQSRSGDAAPDVGADELGSPPADPPLAERLLATVFEDGTLLEVDPATGASDPIGCGPRDLVGLAARNGRLYGLWNADLLIELDPATGAAVAASAPGLSPGAEGDVAIRRDGYAVATRDDVGINELWRFSVSGATAPALLQPNLPERLDGLAFAPTGLLVGLSDSGALVGLDASTGVETPIGPTGLALGGTAGIAFSPEGSLYAVAGDSLYTLDTATATPHLLGPLGNGPFASGGVSGLAFVPEPSDAAQLAVAGALLGLLRRRTRARAS
jgi:hypothetical protein